MVRQNWMTRMYQWMGVPEKVVNVIVKLMEEWKTRLDISEDGKVLTSRKTNTRKHPRPQSNFYKIALATHDFAGNFYLI